MRGVHSHRDGTLLGNGNPESLQITRGDIHKACHLCCGRDVLVVAIAILVKRSDIREAVNYNIVVCYRATMVPREQI